MRPPLAAPRDEPPRDLTDDLTDDPPEAEIRLPPLTELLREHVLPALTHDGHAAPDTRVADPDAPAPPPGAATDVLRAAEPPTVTRRRAPTGPPQIHVSIGRVEVIKPKPPAPLPPPVRRPSGPDHAAYLARRRDTR